MQKVARWAIRNCKKLGLLTNVVRCNSISGSKKIDIIPKSIPFLILTTLIGILLGRRLYADDTGLFPLNVPRIKAIEKDSLRYKFNFIGSVVQKCAPAVVYIEIQDPRRIDPETNEPMIISNGSGFIVRDDGWILTNAHVVISKPHAIIAVKMHDGSVLHAVVEDADMNIDLALLKVNARRKLPALNFAVSDDVSVGEWVVALGSPLSLSHSVTAGIISSTNRPANELGLRNHSMEYIQTDASITFGNSGGPLVNLDGNVIGINNLRITAGISFAIPIAYAKKFLRNGRHPLGDHNKPKSAHDTKQLGIATVQMTDIVIEELQLKESMSGVFVWKVILDSPASRSGLKAGDIITHVNGITINQITDIYKRLKGSSVKLDIVRGGEKKEIELKLQ
ncbi:Peptidase family M50 [Popillia japonica]|uniref:Serine protease HTRA2, mitochondrial n=1 Tax=Popillia japonica TaxID=7064 RepID=A0AAW1KGA5_POPJA